MNQSLLNLIRAIEDGNMVDALCLACEINDQLKSKPATPVSGMNSPPGYSFEFSHNGNLIQAVKAYRQVTDSGLSEAKKQIDSGWPCFSTFRQVTDFLKLFYGYRITSLETAINNLKTGY